MPMGERIPNFSMIGVYYKQPAGIKFVKIHTKHLEGKWCVILFMDNKSSDLEIEKWKAFSSSFDEFNEMNVKLIGVCTDSHIAVRAFMHDHHLQGIKFPIISDLEGELSRSFGVLKIHKDKTGAAKFDAARAVVILNDKSEMVYLQLKNEKVASDPRDIISFLRNAKAEKSPENLSNSKMEKTPENPSTSKMEKTPENPSTSKMEKTPENSSTPKMGTEDSESEDNISLKSNRILFEKDKKFQ